MGRPGPNYTPESANFVPYVYVPLPPAMSLVAKTIPDNLFTTTLRYISVAVASEMIVYVHCVQFSGVWYEVERTRYSHATVWESTQIAISSDQDGVMTASYTGTR